jgi:hypothetical protein
MPRMGIELRVLASALVFSVGIGPALGADVHRPFEHDKKVCATFAKYFKRENELFAKDRQEIAAGGHNPGQPALNDFVMLRDHGPWGGIEMLGQTEFDPEFDRRPEIGFKARDINGRDINATGYPFQAFKADLLNDGDIRLVIVFGAARGKTVANYVMVFKPNRPLEIEERPNEYDTDMTIIGPKSDDVDMIIGQMDVAWDYVDMMNGKKIIKPINTSDSDQNDEKTYFDDMYYLYEYNHMHPVVRSYFVYPGMKSAKSALMVSKSDWIDRLIEGSRGWIPQKAYKLGGRYYFVMGVPISPSSAPGEWEVYHLAPGLKVEVDCAFEPSAAVNRRQNR